MPPDFIKQFLSIYPQVGEAFGETLLALNSEPEAMTKLLPSDFHWNYLYELSQKELSILLLAAVGLLDPLLKLHGAGGDINSALLNIDIEAIVDSWDGGHHQMFLPAHVIAISIANGYSIQALEFYGCYMSELLVKTNGGCDESLFNALRVDPSIISLSSFSGRLARATLSSQEDFFKELSNALLGGPHKALEDNKEMRVILQLLNEINALASMSMTDLDRLFIRELKLYSQWGDDPPRSLMRFVQRWKENKPAAT